MIQMFSAYIKTIVGFLIFMAFAEIIMPDNKFKKYISLILGFLMIITVVKPVSALLSKNSFDFSKLVEQKQEEIAMGSLLSEEEYIQAHDQLVMDIYQENLNTEIRSAMETENIEVIEAVAIINNDPEDENYGNLLGANITAAEKEEAGSYKIVQIEPVKVFGSDNSSTEYQNSELENKIYEILEEKFYLSEEKVNITIRKI